MLSEQLEPRPSSVSVKQRHNPRPVATRSRMPQDRWPQVRPRLGEACPAVGGALALASSSAAVAGCCTPVEVVTFFVGCRGGGFGLTFTSCGTGCVEGSLFEREAPLVAGHVAEPSTMSGGADASSWRSATSRWRRWAGWRRRGPSFGRCRTRSAGSRLVEAVAIASNS